MTESNVAEPYPVRVYGRLDEPLSRGLWLVKWLLAIPHYIVLAFLWLAFTVLTVIVFFAILFTGRYPRAIFDFNVGVMRWSWRVHYYAYAALGTDRYPPFTLADVPDYPARLEVDYPQQLSRGLVLVKWWLLALPHYVIVAILAGGGLWITLGSDDGRFQWAAGGLIGILVLVAGIILTFTARYPRHVYDFVLGMDRWVIRVGAYAALMTDAYPPFRLDQGGSEPGAPTPPTPDTPTTLAEPAATSGTSAWTGGRIASVVIGAVFGMISMGLLTGGATLLWVDQVQRDDAGYLSTSRTFDSAGYAVASDKLTTTVPGAGELSLLRALLGDMMVQATPGESGTELFVGIGPAADVARYLADVPHTQVGDFAQVPADTVGERTLAPPAGQDFWVAQASGPGMQRVVWPVESGEWTVVVANADGSRGVDATVRAGAEVPALLLSSVLLLASGFVLILFASVLIAVPAGRASARPEATKTNVTS